VTTLRNRPASERDVELNVSLAEHQRHCVSPDRLCDAVRRRVLFRPEHGERSHSYELLHSPRMFVVQDNVEVVEHRDAAVYSTVVETPSYRFTMETATDNRPGRRPSICHFRCYTVLTMVYSTQNYWVLPHVFTIFPPFLCIGAHALGFVGYVCSTNFYLIFYPTSMHVRVLARLLL
jgi:hypothetical protein